MSRCRLYVGNLPPDVREKDLEDIFQKYGRIEHLDLRTNKGPPFAFLDFGDARDAEDAMYGRDGYDFDGYRMRVERPRSYRDTGGFSRGSGGGSGGGGRYERDRHGGTGFRRNRYDSTMRRSQYRILVTGLPPSGSWQDLKDHMREAGDVCYADVNKDGTGHVEYLREEDMKYALKKLDDTKFRSHEGETAYIRVRIDGGRRSRSRTRSRTRSRSVSKGQSRSRSPIDRANGSPAANGQDGRRSASLSGSPRSRHSGSRSPSAKSRSGSANPPAED